MIAGDKISVNKPVSGVGRMACWKDGAPVFHAGPNDFWRPSIALGEVKFEFIGPGARGHSVRRHLPFAADVGVGHSNGKCGSVLRAIDTSVFRA